MWNGGCLKAPVRENHALSAAEGRTPGSVRGEAKSLSRHLFETEIHRRTDIGGRIVQLVDQGAE